MPENDVEPLGHPDPNSLVTPDPDDDEGTPQAPSKRFPWSKPKVPTKATLAEKREFKRAHAQTEDTK